MLSFVVKLANLVLLGILVLGLVNFTAPDGSMMLYVPALPTMMMTFEKNWIWLNSVLQRIIAYLYSEIYLGLLSIFST